MAYQPVPSPSSGFHHINSPFGDTTFTKIFVGGLAWETQSETLRRHFEQFGEILEAVVITDKNTGRSKGYGFVTFRDPEAARIACADPTPIIDGRRANCNLASLGRLRQHLPYSIIPNVPGSFSVGRARSASLYVGGVQGPRRAYVGNFSYQQQFPYSYQQGPVYPSYGLAAYGPEYIYPQGTYGSYMGQQQQQYLQLYGVPAPVNTTVYPYGQPSQSVPSTRGYSTVQGYTLPGNQVMRFGGPSVSLMTTSPMPTVQAPYPAAMLNPVPARPQFLVPAPQFMQVSGTDQTTG